MCHLFRIMKGEYNRSKDHIVTGEKDEENELYTEKTLQDYEW